MLLAIDTSTRYGGVCLRDEKRVVASLTWYSPRNHTRELLPAIQQILKQAECSASMLSTVMVALGPGGFSALRVGVSVAKGMALSLGIPLVGAGTLEMESYPYAEMGLPVCPLLDMGRGEVAAALYSSVDGEWRKVMGEEVQSVEALVESLRHRAHERVLFCGEGLEGREEALRAVLGRCGPGGLALYPHVEAMGPGQGRLGKV